MSDHNALLARFDERIDDVAQRLTALETASKEKRKRPLVDRLGAWGGLLALVISLTTGALTVWDDVIFRAAKLAKAEQEQAEDWLGEFQTISAEIFAANAAGDYARGAALMEAKGAARLTLLKNLEEIVVRRPELFSIFEKASLINGALEFGDAQTAKTLADVVATEVASPIDRMNLDLWYARIFATPGPLFDPGQARIRFRSVDDRVRLEVPPGFRPQQEMILFNFWITFELTLGNDCPELTRLAGRLSNAFSSPSAPPALRQSYGQPVQLALDTVAQRCP